MGNWYARRTNFSKVIKGMEEKRERENKWRHYTGTLDFSTKIKKLLSEFVRSNILIQIVHNSLQTFTCFLRILFVWMIIWCFSVQGVQQKDITRDSLNC